MGLVNHIQPFYNSMSRPDGYKIYTYLQHLGITHTPAGVFYTLSDIQRAVKIIKRG